MVRLHTMFEIKEIKKKPTQPFFKGLQVGDCITVAFTLNGGYHSAPRITVTKSTGIGEYYGYVSSLASILDRFELVEVRG